jgi:hypothetical protein
MSLKMEINHSKKFLKARYKAPPSFFSILFYAMKGKNMTSPTSNYLTPNLPVNINTSKQVLKRIKVMATDDRYTTALSPNVTILL